MELQDYLEKIEKNANKTLKMVKYVKKEIEKNKKRDRRGSPPHRSRKHRSISPQKNVVEEEAVQGSRSPSPVRKVFRQRIVSPTDIFVRNWSHGRGDPIEVKNWIKDTFGIELREPPFVHPQYGWGKICTCNNNEQLIILENKEELANKFGFSPDDIMIATKNRGD